MGTIQEPGSLNSLCPPYDGLLAYLSCSSTHAESLPLDAQPTLSLPAQSIPVTQVSSGPFTLSCLLLAPRYTQHWSIFSDTRFNENSLQRKYLGHY